MTARLDALLLRWASVPRSWWLLAGAVAAGTLVVAGSGLVIAKLVDDVLGADGVTRLDPHVTEWVVDRRQPTLTSAATAITRLGDPVPVVVVVTAAAIALLAARRWRLALLVVISSGGAAAVTALGKLVVSRPRPAAELQLVDTVGAAFPSGHATQSVACWGALGVVAVVLTRRRWVRAGVVAIAGALAVGIGTSRVYLGVHWLSDVVCGWAVAALWLWLLVGIGWLGARVGPPLRRGLGRRHRGG